ncbi:hypothetical protein Taro_033900 [Colocasia esculenta]|uniref:Uncharacterized protein n=1 Tax=Colocasia esculenta TaxID=4460 RepID=A0A843WDW2_COLES|nr:hypothetical protein [Colocasia esculenta]
MVLPTSLFFAFSKRKQHQECNLLGKPQGVEVNCEGRIGKDTFEQRNDADGGRGDDHPINGITADGSPKPSPVSEGEAEEILLDSMEQIPACSDSSMSDDEWRGDAPNQIPSSSDDEDMDRALASSESSISDEESLIEITLTDGHPVGADPPENTIFRLPNSKGFLPRFSPELVLRQQELLEIFSEMNEEDNLIEIDIAMGSVKCSALRGIEA